MVLTHARRRTATGFGGKRDRRLSHATLFPDAQDRTRYASLAGQPSPKQLDLLRVRQVCIRSVCIDQFVSISLYRSVCIDQCLIARALIFLNSIGNFWYCRRIAPSENFES